VMLFPASIALWCKNPRPRSHERVGIGTQLRPMIEKAPLAVSANEAWRLLSCFAFLDVMLVPFAWKMKPVDGKKRFSTVADRIRPDWQRNVPSTRCYFTGEARKNHLLRMADATADEKSGARNVPRLECLHDVVARVRSALGELLAHTRDCAAKLDL
jgi:hypothetical protein